MRLRLNDQAVLYIEFMVEQHPEKHSSFLPFLCQRYAITGALQLSTTFLQLLKREGRHKRTRDEWKKFHEPRIVQALKPYRAAWSRMKGAEFCSIQKNRRILHHFIDPCGFLYLPSFRPHRYKPLSACICHLQLQAPEVHRHDCAHHIFCKRIPVHFRATHPFRRLPASLNMVSV